MKNAPTAQTEAAAIAYIKAMAIAADTIAAARRRNDKEAFRHRYELGGLNIDWIWQPVEACRQAYASAGGTPTPQRWDVVQFRANKNAQPQSIVYRKNWLSPKEYI